MQTNAHRLDIKTFGTPLGEADKAIIMLHGRGGSAEDIVHSLQSHLQLKDFAVLAPQATNYTWYPLSFLAPPAQNEPWLSSALETVGATVDKVLHEGIEKSNLYFLGFSQGACLMLEYVTRNAARYGGVFAYSGGLIGDKVYGENYRGNFGGTPVLLGCSDVDPHIPLQRVYATENILKEKDADVQTRIYPNMAHTINGDEIEKTNNILVSNDSEK